MVGMAILRLGSRQEAVKRNAAVQQRFKLSLSHSSGSHAGCWQVVHGAQ